MRVLLVEDNQTEAMMVTGILEQAEGTDCTVTVVETLEAAFDQIQGGEVDVVLLDLNLRDSQGLDTFVAVRNRAPDLPVVVVTAAGDTPLGRQAVELGAADFLPKGRLDQQGLPERLVFAVDRQQAAGQALHDPLTGLPTAALFGDRLRAALKRSAVERRFVAVFWIGLDNFSALTESLDAAGIDACVVDSAARLRSALRPADTLARVATAEFGAIAEDVLRPGNAERAANRLLGAFVAPSSTGEAGAATVADPTPALTVSVGVALGRSQHDADTLIALAQQTLREIRYAGGAAVRIARAGD